MFTTQILTIPASNITPPMPQDVDNGLPGVEMWFGRNKFSEVGMLCHLDSCAVINTENLHVHKSLITTYLHLVIEYIQYDDAKSFQPFKLACVVRKHGMVDSMYEKLTTIVRYWLRYQVNDKYITLSFGLREDVAINFIIGSLTLRKWSGNLNLVNTHFLFRP